MNQKSISLVVLIAFAAGAIWWGWERQPVLSTEIVDPSATNGAERTSLPHEYFASGQVSEESSRERMAAVESDIEHGAVADSWSRIEESLVLSKGNGVSQKAANKLLGSDTSRFHRLMDSMQSEMLGNPIAHAQGEDYRELMVDQLRQIEGNALRMDRFACSERMCLAHLSGSDAGWSAYRAGLRTYGVDAFPAYNRLFYTYQDPTTGRADYRMLFTTDPRLNSIQMDLSGTRNLRIGRLASGAGKPE